MPAKGSRRRASTSSNTLSATLRSVVTPEAKVLKKMPVNDHQPILRHHAAPVECWISSNVLTTPSPSPRRCRAAKRRCAFAGERNK
jgi:hypothetical protein